MTTSQGGRVGSKSTYRKIKFHDTLFRVPWRTTAGSGESTFARPSRSAVAMATRVFLRRNGSSEPGCMAKLPPTWAELLAVADTKLFRQPGSGAAKRIFAVSGDEILDDDYDLIGALRLRRARRVALDRRSPATAAGAPALPSVPALHTERGASCVCLPGREQRRPLPVARRGLACAGRSIRCDSGRALRLRSSRGAAGSARGAAHHGRLGPGAHHAHREVCFRRRGQRALQPRRVQCRSGRARGQRRFERLAGGLAARS